MTQGHVHEPNRFTFCTDCRMLEIKANEPKSSCTGCGRLEGEQHDYNCPEYDLVGDLPGMAGWWSGGFAENH